jgi:hypothetical protein
MFLAVRRGVMNNPLKLFDEIRKSLSSKWVMIGTAKKLSYVNKFGNKFTWANSSGLESQTTKMTQMR